VKGEPLAPIEIEQKLAKRFRLLGTQGLVGIALAAIDMALWDALARSRGTSLVRLLGGIEKAIPAYGAVGYDGVEGSAKVAEDWAKRGFSGVKAKIGYPTVQEDIAVVVRAMRKAVGDSVAIMIDYNQSLTPSEAVERLRALDKGLTWVEEPTLAHDYAGHALIARAAKTPIQCGENWWGALDMQHAIDAQASDFMMPDVMKIGGVTGWLRAAALAQTKGIRLSNHLWPEISAQLLCATPTAHWLEYECHHDRAAANQERVCVCERCDRYRRCLGRKGCRTIFGLVNPRHTADQYLSPWSLTECTRWRTSDGLRRLSTIWMSHIGPTPKRRDVRC
jgi:mandelate racemase